MALNYRYDKKGNVTGIGWGKGKNYEAGQKKLKSNQEQVRKKQSTLKNKKNEKNKPFKANLKINKGLSKNELFMRKYNPWSESNKKLRALEKQSKDTNLSHSDRAKARSSHSAVKRIRDDVTIAQVQEKNKQAMKASAGKLHTDWKRMRKGDITKEQFVKMYPNSNTAKEWRKDPRNSVGVSKRRQKK